MRENQKVKLNVSVHWKKDISEKIGSISATGYASIVCSAQFKHPVQGLFMVLKKARLEMSKGNKR